MVSRKCVALLLSAAAWSCARADDLAMIYRDALANNAQYQSAEAQYRAVREHVPESVAALLPAVSVAANTLWNDNNSNTLGRQQYNSNYYAVTLTQPVWRPQNFLALDEARSQVVQAQAQLDLAQHELLVRTAQAYFDVLFARDALNTFKEQGAAYQEQLQQASRNFEVGAAPIMDLRDAEARFALVTAQEISASNDLASKMQVLRQITDKEPGPLVGLRAGVVLASPVPDTVGPWETAAQSNSAAVLAAEAALAASRLEVRRIRAEGLPTVDLVMSHGLSKSASSITVGQDLHADTVGIQVSVPIYSGGGSSAKVRENLALVDKAQADLEDAQRSGVLAVEQAYLGATSGLSQVKALQRAVAAAQTALESNKRGVQVGTRAGVDVLNAQQELSVTKRDLAKARYDTVMYMLRLKAAAGSLGAADLDEVNGMLGD
ncbi:MAG: TolC family outer membrane protein [Steroidobacteraceae bacterium]